MKKRFNVKRFTAILIVCMMLLPMSACGSSKVSSADREKAALETEREQKEKEAAKKQEQSKADEGNMKTFDPSAADTSDEKDAAGQEEEIPDNMMKKGIFCSKSIVDFLFYKSIDKGDSVSELSEDSYVIYFDDDCNNYLLFNIYCADIHQNVADNAYEYIKARTNWAGKDNPTPCGNGWYGDEGLDNHPAKALNAGDFDGFLVSYFGVDLTDGPKPEYLIVQYVRKIQSGEKVQGGNVQYNKSAYGVIKTIKTRLTSEPESSAHYAFCDPDEFQTQISETSGNAFVSDWYKSGAIYDGWNGASLTTGWLDGGYMQIMIDGTVAYEFTEDSMKQDGAAYVYSDPSDGSVLKYYPAEDKIDIEDANHPDYTSTYTTKFRKGAR